MNARRLLSGIVAAALLASLARAETATGATPAPTGTLYRAALAAASAHLRLHDTAEARRWLDAAPDTERGWEWRYLRARSDESEASSRTPGAPLSGVAVSPDGTIVAAASSDHTVRLWRAQTLEPLRAIAGHAGPVWTTHFSPDGSRLVTASSDGTARLFDVASGGELRRLEGIGSGIAAASFSPDGKELATCSWKRSAERGVWGVVTIWDAASGESRRVIEHGEKPIVALAWSPDGERLAAGTWDADVAVWSRASWALLHRLVPPADEGYQAVQSIAWSADGSRLAVGAKDGTARVWSLPQARLERTQLGQAEGQRSWVNGLAFLPGGELLSAQADGTLRAFAADGRSLATWHGHAGPVQAVAVAPGGRTAFTTGRDGELRRWSVAGLQSRRTVWVPGQDAYELAWSPDGARAAITGWTGFVQVREVASGRTVASWTGHEESGAGIAWSRDGRRLATSGNDGGVRLWRPDGTAVATLEEGAGRQIASVAFSADSRRVAAPARHGVKVWNAGRGELEATLVEHPDDAKRAVVHVAWSPDGTMLAATGRDGRVVIWNVAERRPARSWELGPGQRFVDFAPAGGRIAIAASDGAIAIHELSSGDRRALLTGHGGAVQAVRYSPDGSRLASAGGDGTARIWDPATGELLLTLPFDAAIHGLAWSPDGSSLAVVPLDGTVRLLESDPAAPPPRAGSLTRRAGPPAAPCRRRAAPAPYTRRGR
jgi:WD40 repeat protein